MKSMGYFVFTIPESLRGRYRSQARLNELSKKITSGDKSRHIEGLLKNMGFERGLFRWHWFGDKSTKWHPHLNVLVDGGYLTPAQLAAIRERWADILGLHGASADIVNFPDYSYTTEIPLMVHKLQYVTRATFRDYTWDPYMAGQLYRFRNMRSWGKWDEKPVWEMREGKSEVEIVTKLEKGVCPECGKPVKWGKAKDINWLHMAVASGQVKPVGAGYWLDSS